MSHALMITSTFISSTQTLVQMRTIDDALKAYGVIATKVKL